MAGRADLRWYTKKLARQGTALGSWATGSLAIRGHLLKTQRLRALTYHRIADEPYNPFCVSEREFEAQIQMLAAEGRAVSFEQTLAFVQGRETLPQNACLVTIDDGMLSTLTRAYPILRHYGVPAVAFVSSNLVGRDVGHEDRYLTWEELDELAASELVTIGSHAHTHRSLGHLPIEQAREEAATSRRVLEDNLGRKIETFAYPFGMRTDFSPDTDEALADAGYALAFNSMHGSIRAGMSLFSLPRVKIEGGESLFAFSLITLGGLDPWRMVDRHLWSLQMVREEVA